MPPLSPTAVRQRKLVTIRYTFKGAVIQKKKSKIFHFHLHLSIVVLDDLKVKEVVLILSTQGGIPTSGLWNLKLVLGAEIIS